MVAVSKYIVERRRIAMLAFDKPLPNQGKMDARKQVRMHRSEEKRIESAAQASGMRPAEFMRLAALQCVEEIEQGIRISRLPAEAFDAFQIAVESSGKVVPGLVRAAKASKGLQKDGN